VKSESESKTGQSFSEGKIFDENQVRCYDLLAMYSFQHRVAFALFALLPSAACAQERSYSPAAYLHFDGASQYVEVPSAPEFSVSDAGLTVSAWIMADTLTFPNTEGSGYVHWMGKGEAGKQEWVLRMYNESNTEKPPRPNRISFYVFNSDGGLGVGSYFQKPVKAKEWIQVTGVVDGHRTYIYRNGAFERCDEFQGSPDGVCQAHPEVIRPQSNDAPLRIGTRDSRSFFQGGLAEIRIWERALSSSEIEALYQSGSAPPAGLAAEFLLNEGEGTIAHDSARHHDGRIVGATWIRP